MQVTRRTGWSLLFLPPPFRPRKKGNPKPLHCTPWCHREVPHVYSSFRVWLPKSWFQYRSVIQAVRNSCCLQFIDAQPVCGSDGLVIRLEILQLPFHCICTVCFSFGRMDNSRDKQNTYTIYVISHVLRHDIQTAHANVCAWIAIIFTPSILVFWNCLWQDRRQWQFLNFSFTLLCVI